MEAALTDQVEEQEYDTVSFSVKKSYECGKLKPRCERDKSAKVRSISLCFLQTHLVLHLLVSHARMTLGDFFFLFALSSSQSFGNTFITVKAFLPGIK